MVDIKKTIKAYGMTITDVATLLGISRHGLNFHIQQGDKVTISTLQKIADILGCSVQDFFYNDAEQGLQIKCPHCGKKISLQEQKEPTENQ